MHISPICHIFLPIVNVRILWHTFWLVLNCARRVKIAFRNKISTDNKENFVLKVNLARLGNYELSCPWWRETFLLCFSHDLWSDFSQLLDFLSIVSSQLEYIEMKPVNAPCHLYDAILRQAFYTHLIPGSSHDESIGALILLLFDTQETVSVSFLNFLQDVKS